MGKEEEEGVGKETEQVHGHGMPELVQPFHRAFFLFYFSHCSPSLWRTIGRNFSLHSSSPLLTNILPQKM